MKEVLFLDSGEISPFFGLGKNFKKEED